jgi:hypothetical protein
LITEVIPVVSDQDRLFFRVTSVSWKKEYKIIAERIDTNVVRINGYTG